MLPYKLITCFNCKASWDRWEILGFDSTGIVYRETACPYCGAVNMDYDIPITAGVG